MKISCFRHPEETARAGLKAAVADKGRFGEGALERERAEPTSNEDQTSLQKKRGLSKKRRGQDEGVGKTRATPARGTTSSSNKQ